jgi:hypothetical protein
MILNTTSFILYHDFDHETGESILADSRDLPATNDGEFAEYVRAEDVLDWCRQNGRYDMSDADYPTSTIHPVSEVDDLIFRSCWLPRTLTREWEAWVRDEHDSAWEEHHEALAQLGGPDSGRRF